MQILYDGYVETGQKAQNVKSYDFVSAFANLAKVYGDCTKYTQSC